MLKIEQVEVTGWGVAIRGMRNSFNSWGKSDSDDVDGEFVVGYGDLKLMKTLARGGSSHAKYRRFITVTLDITAPLYWWKEFDTYKVGTAANSCSTMHTIAQKPFTPSDFSCEHLFDTQYKNEDKSLIVDCELTFEEIFNMGYTGGFHLTTYGALTVTIAMLNRARELYLKTKDKRYWWQMIQLLPSSYNQKRTVDLNYEVLHSMYYDRRHHKLDEWREFCKWIESLPYAEGIIYEEGD